MTFLLNLLWFVSCLRGWLLFRAASHNVRRAQIKVLRRICKENKLCSSRKQSDLLNSLGQLPLTEYADYRTAIDEIASGHLTELTRTPVKMLQPTSGSTGGMKYIPYHHRLQKEFQQAINPWIADLYLSCPSLFGGKHYWSISPTTHVDRIKSRVKTGFADDSDYLGPTQRKLARRLMALPQKIRDAAGANRFDLLTILSLVKEKNLRMVSVWHPSFFTLLLDQMKVEWFQLCEAVRTGEGVDKRIPPDPIRAGELDKVDWSKPDAAQSIWPNLKVISCWKDGHSELWVKDIQARFPRVRIQGKGLIATEGIISIPFGGKDAPVCAINSHFYEFIEPDSGSVKRAWELEKGKTYSVVLTTSGGLTRYRLHDLVEVVGFYRKAPRLRFKGKDRVISDLFGEKIHLTHVRDILEELAVPARFMMLAPVQRGGLNSYTLFIEPAEQALDFAQLAEELEKKLSMNFHYLHARHLKQLGPASVFRISSDGTAAYRQRMTNRGFKAGDVKIDALRLETDWDKVFEGEMIA